MLRAVGAAGSGGSSGAGVGVKGCGVGSVVSSRGISMLAANNREGGPRDGNGNGNGRFPARVQ